MFSRVRWWNDWFRILYFLGGIKMGYKQASKWTEEIDSYHGNAVYLCAGASTDDPFRSTSFILRVLTAYTSDNSPRTIQEAISVYGSSSGTRRYRVYNTSGWSQWFTVGTV